MILLLVLSVVLKTSMKFEFKERTPAFEMIFLVLSYVMEGDLETLSLLLKFGSCFVESLLPGMLLTSLLSKRSTRDKEESLIENVSSKSEFTVLRGLVFVELNMLIALSLLIRRSLLIA